MDRHSPHRTGTKITRCSSGSYGSTHICQMTADVGHQAGVGSQIGMLTVSQAQRHRNCQPAQIPCNTKELLMADVATIHGRCQADCCKQTNELITNERDLAVVNDKTYHKGREPTEKELQSATNSY